MSTGLPTSTDSLFWIDSANSGFGAGDLDKLGNRCCFLPGIPVSEILLPLRFAHGEGREHLGLRSRRIISGLDDRVGGAIIQGVVLLQRHGYQHIRLFHGAKFVGGDHDGDGFTQHSEAGKGRRWTEWLGFQMDANDNIGPHLFRNVDRECC